MGTGGHWVAPRVEYWDYWGQWVTVGSSDRWALGGTGWLWVALGALGDNERWARGTLGVTGWPKG